jgi:hypothetical protein
MDANIAMTLLFDALRSARRRFALPKSRKDRAKAATGGKCLDAGADRKCIVELLIEAAAAEPRTAAVRLNFVHNYQIV